MHWVDHLAEGLGDFNGHVSRHLDVSQIIWKGKCY